MTPTCLRCQNRKATKILVWRVYEAALVESGETTYVVRSGVYCDECCALELADRHRADPTVEAIT